MIKRKISKHVKRKGNIKNDVKGIDISSNTIIKDTKSSNPSSNSSERKNIYSTQNRIIRIFLVICLIISLGTLLGTISFTIYRVGEHEDYNSKVLAYTEIDAIADVVPGVVGMNGDTDALKFGKVNPGGGGARFIDVNTTQEAIIEIYFSGDIANFLSVEKNQYVIEPGVNEHIRINIDIPSDARTGTYTGKVHVTLLKR